MIPEKVLKEEIRLVKIELKRYLKAGQIDLAAEQYHILHTLEFVRDYKEESYG